MGLTLAMVLNPWARTEAMPVATMFGVAQLA
jgi:hypothetical protein